DQKVFILALVIKHSEVECMASMKIPLVFEHSESSSVSNGLFERVVPPSGQTVADSNLAWAKKVGRGKRDSDSIPTNRTTPFPPSQSPN
ncbi:MAG: hypothetical protein AABX02_04560, partial [archaeon]